MFPKRLGDGEEEHEGERLLIDVSALQRSGFSLLRVSHGTKAERIEGNNSGRTGR